MALQAQGRQRESETEGGMDGGRKKNVNQREKRQHKKSQTTLMRESGERRRVWGGQIR